MSKNRVWISDTAPFEDNDKPCGHTRDEWICSQCASKQIKFAEAERDALKAETEKLEAEWAAATEAYESIYVKCRKLESRLERITTKANEQAEDVALWAVYPTGTQPISEAYLQQELRALHRVIEENT